ncbi:UPF0676 protein C1494.01-like isoform X2 [Orbicella faveolata]|uniref:UPF0676 protein C1494.01-like isoform X2 n=1 Tax=Orbicella faveolata TaxID=48498 RepID=UPI0009E20E5F|nr:UPF0676 protein C1494.01-like isoform X2 [Orbicella faveolata]XP_020632103.1 UPF0676 protein C1494.01-like isoform X2 [Orbicella faveolata]
MADAADGVIPVVDFGIMGLNCQNPPSLDEDSVKLLAEKIYTAFSTIGFVYLTKHGISDAEISEVRRVGDGFFHLPTDVKKQFTRPSDGRNFGWVSLERESLNPQRPGDLKEAYNVCELEDESQKWPDQQVPDFRPTVTSFFNKCKNLTFRILDVVGIGLKLQDPKWLAQVHGSIGTSGNPTALRLLYYPPLPEESIIKPEQVRCGEHSDYGSITLLFQDSVGGLEVSNGTVLNLLSYAYHKAPEKLCGPASEWGIHPCKAYFWNCACQYWRSDATLDS